MSELGSLGLARPPRLGRPEDGIEVVAPNRVLTRILSFAGFSLDELVNDPIAKNAVRGYFKLNKEIDRRLEILELEEQWMISRRRVKG